MARKVLQSGGCTIVGIADRHLIGVDSRMGHGRPNGRGWIRSTVVSHWRSPRDDRTPRRQIPHSMGDYGEIGHPEIISQANPGVLQRDVCSDMISRTAMAEFRGSAIQPQTPIREVTVRQSRIRQTPGETGSRLHRKNQAPKELPCLHGNCANPAGCAATSRTGLCYRNPGLRASECQASEAKHT